MKGIYQIVFENGKSYIGQSNDLKRRFREYKNWKNTCKHQTALYNAFKKHKNYNIKILEQGGNLTQTDLDTKEIYYIKEYNTLTPNGYNIQIGGHFNYRCKVDLNLLFNNSEPIINKETGEVYNNCEDWMNKNLEIKLDNQYDLYEKDYKFQFKNPENVIYFGDTFPENATLKDIFEGKAIPYVLSISCKANL